MSILNALKQHNGSIDELAKLPQNLIMQMAQRKEIGPELVAPILARKAQMADAVARTKALQKGQAQGTAPTVMEQLMQKTADTEQPEPQEMGIASNPIPERNYAGGGIVAFADGGPAWSDLPEMQQNPNQWRGLFDIIGSTYNPKKINPLTGKPVTQTEYEAIAQKAQAPKLSPMPTNVKADTLGRTDAAKQDSKAATSPTGNRPTGLKALTSASNIEQAGPQRPSELQELMAQERARIEGGAEDAAKAKKEAMWNRLLEAGLNVMGGQSSNFAQNMALAGPAAKGYGEDVKGLRAEEAARRKQLGELGLKGYELTQAAKKAAAEEAYMKQHGTYYDRAGQAALIAANRPTAGAYGAEKVDIAALKVGLDNAQKALLTAKKADKPAIQQQIDTYVNRINSLAGIGGAAPAASASGAFNYVPGKGLVPVQ